MNSRISAEICRPIGHKERSISRDTPVRRSDAGLSPCFLARSAASGNDWPSASSLAMEPLSLGTFDRCIRTGTPAWLPGCLTRLGISVPQPPPTHCAIWPPYWPPYLRFLRSKQRKTDAASTWGQRRSVETRSLDWGKQHGIRLTPSPVQASPGQASRGAKGSETTHNAAPVQDQMAC